MVLTDCSLKLINLLNYFKIKLVKCIDKTAWLNIIIMCVIRIMYVQGYKSEGLMRKKNFHQ